jgi:hypothetical protein
LRIVVERPLRGGPSLAALQPRAALITAAAIATRTISIAAEAPITVVELTAAAPLLSAAERRYVEVLRYVEVACVLPAAEAGEARGAMVCVELRLATTEPMSGASQTRRLSCVQRP